MERSVLDEHGILLRRDAVAQGLDDDWLARMVRGGELTRIRHGAYVDADIWAKSSPAHRHDLTSRAVMQWYDDRVALSHTSNIVRRGGPDWGLDLTTVHVTNLFGRGDRIKAGITHHRGECRVNDVTRLDGHWVTAAPRAALETALLSGRDPAVCVLDWALNSKLASLEDFADLVDPLMREWPGSVDLGYLVSLSHPKRASVGETRMGLFLDDHGFAGAEPQWQVDRPDGRVAGIVDFALHRERVMIEFDGKIKYGRLLKPGQTISDVIMDERAREKLLEELTGYRMFRVIWSDFRDRAALAARLRRVIAMQGARIAS
ncbi:MAG TPA: type IV toxin-antitoxin system AbiEi family antitoxin domain-containing protein [Nocardioides sp.]|uniref:type IV toxin-antitoxin system AbiEi family antitoxin domain-containing protein n=1 Tax=uncultured Nocardioides sp. TaxID=198441 RepID=UPI00262F83C3|nr:type IV toxin-antitoxin system AbiEi family antitoxin domain-containing protein [uncultured Nocardioides sp.]HRD61290.1 type IV toxin-antitoxin system AbiEi family antitoxin domain-containing protein [Nocardioides sp.]HRI95852.1 type IV toxin-antitoxin system AbiEi family antitoxin domain-containing protein [Nocardioides sp.]HRK45609.1 type IV toxin-antitoxin system AbiEi family antitoxin domain-containing protein [Nocardioides sp.]